MPDYVILARKRWGEKCIPLTQVKCGEQSAVAMAQGMHKKQGMNRTLLVDAKFKIVFKIDRRCRCINVQYMIDDKLMCEECKRIIVEDRNEKGEKI